jgi:alpha-maltose-1-phosphate synthase
MKILLLTEGDAETRDSWSGTSLSVLEHLRARGHEVRTEDVDLTGGARLLAIAGEFSMNRKRWWVKYHLGPRPFRMRSARAGRAIRRHSDVDVIFQFGATFAPVGAGAIPVVLYCDGNMELSWKGRHVAPNDASVLDRDEADRVAAREREVYRSATTILSISDRLRESFIEDFQIPPERVKTVFAGPNFDLDRIPVIDRPRDDGPPTVLFVGRQFHRKGGDLLLRSFERVRHQMPKARLVVIGPDRLDDPFGEGVDFRGFLNKDTRIGEEALFGAYAEADVFCMPSRFEGFAISFLEAMAFGLPCVSTRPPWAPPEMIVDGETGFLVDPEDEVALADRLISLLKDPQKAGEMGRAGRERLHARFTWPSVVAHMETNLDKAVRTPGGLNDAD